MGRRRGLLPTPLVAGALLAALTLLTAGFGPVGLLSFLLPLPIAYLTYEEGLGAAALAQAIGSAVVWVLLGPFYALGLLLTAFVPGSLFGEGLRTGEGPFASVVSAAGLVLFGMAVFVVTAGLAMSHGQDPLLAVKVTTAALTKNLAAAEPSLRRAYEANGLSPRAAAKAAEGVVSSVRRNVLPALPAILVLGVGVDAVAAYAATRLLLRRHLLPPVRPFAEWASPPWLPALFLAATALMMWLPAAAAPAAAAAENVFLVAGAVLAVHGLAVLYFYLVRLRAGRTLSLLALAAAVLVPLGLALLAWLAVADSLADFRRLGRRHGGV